MFSKALVSFEIGLAIIFVRHFSFIDHQIKFYILNPGFGSGIVKFVGTRQLILDNR